jgi:hypothetical protein
MKDFLPDGIYERVTGQPNPLKALSWEDLWGNFDMEPTGNTTTSNRELERQKWVFVAESMKNDPLVFSIDPQTQIPTPKAGWYELRKRFLLSHGIDDYKEIIGQPPSPEEEAIPQPEPVSPDIDAIVQAALQGGQPSGGGQLSTAAEMSNPPTGQEMALTGEVPPAATAGTY